MDELESFDDPPARPIRVMIVDDHEMVAQGLARIVSDEPDMTLVSIAHNIADTYAKIAAERPDVLLLDYRLPDGDGAQAMATIRARWPEVKVVMLSGFGANEVMVQAIESGCVGMLSKTRPAEDVVAAVRAAANGESVLRSDEFAAMLAGLTKSSLPQGEGLTAREMDVLRLLARGKSNDEIAGQLFVSANTVRSHIRSVLLKLGAHSKLQAVTLATRKGLLSISDIG